MTTFNTQHRLKLSKPLLLFVAAVLILTSALCAFTSCSLRLGNDEFDAFEKELALSMLKGDGISINILLSEASDFDLDGEDATLPTPSQSADDFVSDYAGLKGIYSYLFSFDYDKLTTVNKQSWDSLFNYFYTLYKNKDYYYFQDQFLGSDSGWNSNLPIYLLKYEFKTKHDVDNYISLLNQTATAFPAYVAYEQKRINAGYGRADFIYEGIVEQCHNFAGENDFGDNDNFLISDFNAKIDACTYLSDVERATYRASMLTALKTKMLPAYRAVAASVKQFVGLSANNNGGLSGYTGGTNYYSYLFSSSTSSSDSVETAYDNLASAYTSAQREFNTLKSTLNMTDAEFNAAMESLSSSSVFPSSDNPTDAEANATLEAIKSDFYAIKSAASADFPSLPDGTAEPTFSLVDKSIKDNYAPASYFLSAIDSVTAPQTIFVNGYSSTGYLGYELISHEGYPGHMLQHSYFVANSESMARNLVGFQGYSEGWAKYVEYYTAKYYGTTTQQNTLYRLYNLQSKMSGYLITMADILVNYKGFDANDLYTDFFSGATKEGVNNIYEFVVENPCNYATYYYGLYKMEHLRSTYTGTDLAFHTAVLSAGPMTYELLQKYI